MMYCYELQVMLQILIISIFYTTLAGIPFLEEPQYLSTKWLDVLIQFLTGLKFLLYRHTYHRTGDGPYLSDNTMGTS